jgi:ferritin-like metal-binding protein YciE
MASAEERLLQWLRDAHAMEEQAEQILSTQAKRLENYPELRKRVEHHLQQTRRQAERVQGCIERQGSSKSVVKDMAGKLVAVGQGLSGLFVGDEVVKASLADYTFENMEIASYKIIIAAAEEVGDTETKRVCQEILHEEEAMASWLEQNLPSLTAQYLKREQTAGATAKH